MNEVIEKTLKEVAQKIADLYASETDQAMHIDVTICAGLKEQRFDDDLSGYHLTVDTLPLIGNFALAIREFRHKHLSAVTGTEKLTQGAKVIYKETFKIKES